MFRDKIVLITGASSGIGRELAVAFAREKAMVMINYSQSQKDAEETLRHVNAQNGIGMLIRADVASETDVARMFGICKKNFGRLDILVNNAGVTEFIPFSELDLATSDVWTRLYDVNVKGTYFCSREGARLMKSQVGANIINLSSQAGLRPMGSSIPYAVSKAAVIHLTQCLAVTLAPEIRVNCLAPGFVTDTSWNDKRRNPLTNQDYLQLSGEVPLKRLAKPADIVNAALFLAREDNFCNGVTLPVDGGKFLA